MLFVAFYASAELGCHLSLGWPLPARVLDLYAEFRVLTNGRPMPHGNSLLGALTHYGLDALDAGEKEAMRDLAIRGGPFTEPEQAALLDYCQTDADALARLLPRMLPRIDLPRAVGVRGRYVAAAARMECRGVPIDLPALERLRRDWDRVKSRLVREVDREYGVFVPAGRRLDPATRFGSAVFESANEWNLDPFTLAEAADYVYQTETEGTRDRLAAIRAARKSTGLTAARVEKLLGAGKDYLDVPGFDVTARDLAGELPDLGIGIGYDPDGVDEDYAPKLWAILCEPDPVPLAKHSPATLGRARGYDRVGRAVRGRRPADVLRGAVGRVPGPQGHPLAATRKRARWLWTTTRSRTWRRCTRPRSGRCASCATRWVRCA